MIIQLVEREDPVIELKGLDTCVSGWIISSQQITIATCINTMVLVPIYTRSPRKHETRNTKIQRRINLELKKRSEKIMNLYEEKCAQHVL